jgi:uncharacterized surface protein with fasciclin (FAS1) repeats
VINFKININMKNILKYTFFALTGLLILTTSCIDENFDDSSDVGITDKKILNNVLNDENQSGELSIFLELVEANGLTGTLTSRRTQDQITVFAPTNDAFEILATDLGYDTAEDMLADSEENLLEAIQNSFDLETTLLEIVENHLSPSNLSSEQIQNGTFSKIGTFSGVNIPVRREAGSFVLNANEDLGIVRSNAEGNGTVHVISRVALPVKFNAAYSWNFGAEFGECSTELEAWTIENVVLEGGSGWACTGFGFEGQGIQANGFSGGAQQVDSWIISPALEADDIIMNTLKFKYASRFDGPNPEIWIISEEDYDAEAAFDMEAWTNLEFNFPAPSSANNDFSDQTVENITDFHSGSFRFAFRYLSGAGATRVTIDNVQVGEE